LRVLDSFQAADIPVLTLKGPALSQQLYDDPGVRSSIDLDLLVPPEALEAAASVLQQQGYRIESPMAWLGARGLAGRMSEVTFRGNDGVGVDLHWSSAPGDFPCQIPDEHLWSSVAFVSIAGRSVPVLAPECLLVYLCIHGTMHCWTKLRWLCDVAMLLTGDRAMNWEQVQQLAIDSRARHAVHLGFHLAHTLLKAPLPASILAAVREDRRAARAATDVARYLTSEMPRPQPSGVARAVFNARLAESKWQGARHVAALLKAPTDADAERLRLPRRLFFLYYPYRAARLAAKYAPLS
jgi:hypothetical protein